jgi:NDP-sugar pyrophosphorylase family protein
MDECDANLGSTRPLKTAALIMAGGRSLRMRSSLGKQHKALVKILGVSMLERNLLALLSHNIREIFLAVSAREKTILAYARGRGLRLARAGGAELKLIVEVSPRGTIGAARAIKTVFHDLLVVNVDNLTSLDLTAFIEHHRSTQAALTIATHIEPFQLPLGQVSVKDGEIVGYQEKPVLPVRLSSGTYVLSKIAQSNIPSHRPSGAPELAHILLREKRKIAAFPHDSHWIDVNDAASVKKAEELIINNSEFFDLWRQPAPVNKVTLCVLDQHRVALLKSRRQRTVSGRKLPVIDVLPQYGTPLRAAEHLRIQMRLPKLGPPHLLASFDELDTQSTERTRHHIFVSRMALARATVPRRAEISWVLISDLAEKGLHIHASARTIAYLQRYVTSQNPNSLGNR